MTYVEFLTRIIDDGIAAARADYADKPHKLRGAVAGFEACRGKSPGELVALWQEAERAAARVRSGDGDIDLYWEKRCTALEVEWVLNCVSVATTSAGGPPLLGHLPTARAAMKYAEVVGVRGAVATSEGN
jgi:hypothetical protein